MKTTTSFKHSFSLRTVASLTFLFTLATLPSSLSAQEKEVRIWPDKTPKEVVLGKGTIQEETSPGGVQKIKNLPQPTLQKYPAPGSKRDKVIIVCPGGAYNVLAVNLEGWEICQWLNSQGYTAYLLRYRVPKNRLGALQDALRAIRMVRAQNPGKQVGIMGFSAGGSLSARAATRFESPSYTAIDDIDKQSCRPDFCALIYPAYLDEGPNHSLTPELTLNAQTPRFFIFQTEKDPYGNSAFTMGAALKHNNTDVELHIYPGGGHGYGLRQASAKVATIWPRLMADWLETF